MKLREYLDLQPRGAIAAMAGSLRISTVYLQQIVARQDGRVPSPELSVLIEQCTAGAVTRRDLRPDDWHRIWPELVTDQYPAPEAPAQQAA